MGILRDIFTTLGGYELTADEEKEVRKLEREERRYSTVTKVVENTKRGATIRHDELGLPLRKDGKPMTESATTAPTRRKSTISELEDEVRMWSEGE